MPPKKETGKIFKCKHFCKLFGDKRLKGWELHLKGNQLLELLQESGWIKINESNKTFQFSPILSTFRDSDHGLPGLKWPALLETDEGEEIMRDYLRSDAGKAELLKGLRDFYHGSSITLEGRVSHFLDETKQPLLCLFVKNFWGEVNSDDGHLKPKDRQDSRDKRRTILRLIKERFKDSDLDSHRFTDLPHEIQNFFVIKCGFDPSSTWAAQCTPEADESDNAAARLYRAQKIFANAAGDIIKKTMQKADYPSSDSEELDEKIRERIKADAQAFKITSAEQEIQRNTMIQEYRKCPKSKRWLLYCTWSVGLSCRKFVKAEETWQDFFTITTIIQKNPERVLSNLNVCEEKTGECEWNTFAKKFEIKRECKENNKPLRRLETKDGSLQVCKACDIYLLKENAKDDARNEMSHGKNPIPLHIDSLNKIIFLLRRLIPENQEAVKQLQELQERQVLFVSPLERQEINDWLLRNKELKRFDKFVSELSVSGCDRDQSSYIQLKQKQFHPQTRVDIMRIITEWVRGGSQQLLYLNGARGVGKTTLLAQLHVEHQLEHMLEHKQFTSVAFFFRNNGPASMLKLDEMVKSVAYQLLLVLSRSPVFKEALMTGFQALSKEVKPTLYQLVRMLWIEPLQKIVADIPKQFPAEFRLVLILDALDELEDEGKTLLELFRASPKDGDRLISLPSFVRVVLSSTREAPKDILLDPLVLHTSSPENQADLKTVALKSFTEWSQRVAAGAVAAAKLEHLASQLCERSHGVFVYVSFACQMLSPADRQTAYSDLDKLHDFICTLPLGVHALYKKYLTDCLCKLELEHLLDEGLKLLRVQLALRGVQTPRSLLEGAGCSTRTLYHMSSLFEPRATHENKETPDSEMMIFHQGMLHWMWEQNEENLSTDLTTGDLGYCRACTQEARVCVVKPCVELVKAFSTGCYKCNHEWLLHLESRAAGSLHNLLDNPREAASNGHCTLLDSIHSESAGESLWQAYIEADQLLRVDTVIKQLQKLGLRCNGSRLREYLKVLTQRCLSFKPPENQHHLVDSLSSEAQEHKNLVDCLHHWVRNPPSGVDISVKEWSMLLNVVSQYRIEISADVLQQMKAANVAPNNVTYTVIVKGLAKRNYMKEAEAILGEMKDAGFRPDVFTYGALIPGWARQMDKASLEAKMEEMKAAGLGLDTEHLLKHLSNYVEANDMKKIRSMLYRMICARVRPDAIIYGVLMKGLQRAGNWKACLDDLYHILDRSGMARDLETRFFNPAFSVLTRAKRWADALALFFAMLNAGHSPDEYSFEVLSCSQNVLHTELSRAMEQWQLGTLTALQQYVSIFFRSKETICLSELKQCYEQARQQVKQLQEMEAKRVAELDAKRVTDDETILRLILRLFTATADASTDLLKESAGKNSLSGVVALPYSQNDNGVIIYRNQELKINRQNVQEPYQDYPFQRNENVSFHSRIEYERNVDRSLRPLKQPSTFPPATVSRRLDQNATETDWERGSASGLSHVSRDVTSKQSVSERGAGCGEELRQGLHAAAKLGERGTETSSTSISPAAAQPPAPASPRRSVQPGNAHTRLGSVAVTATGSPAKGVAAHSAGANTRQRRASC